MAKKNDGEALDHNDKVRQAGGGQRGEMFTYWPEQLVLITDPKHPLYDPRVHWPAQKELIANIEAYGVRVPIIVRMEEIDGEPRAVVVEGRQRVKATIEANKIREGKGEAKYKIVAVRQKLDDTKAIGVMVLTNELRRGDDIATKIEKMVRLRDDYNYTTADLANTFGVSLSTVTRWVALSECSPEIQAAVKNGLPLVAALDIGKMPADKQAAALAEAKAVNDRGGSVVKAAKDMKAGNSQAKDDDGDGASTTVRTRRSMRSVKAVEALLAEITTEMGLDDDGRKLSGPEAERRELGHQMVAFCRYMMGENPNAERYISKHLRKLFSDNLGMKLPDIILKG